MPILRSGSCLMVSVSVCVCAFVSVCLPAFEGQTAILFQIVQLLIDTEHIHTCSLCYRKSQILISPFSIFLSLLLSPPRSSEVQLTVPACPPSLPLSSFPSSLLTPISFYFLLKRWLELAGERSGEFKLFICASLQVLPGPRKGQRGQGEWRRQRGWRDR